MENQRKIDIKITRSILIEYKGKLVFCLRFSPNPDVLQNHTSMTLSPTLGSRGQIRLKDI